MADRIGMRKNLQFHAAWTQPTSKDHQPPCQTWRDKLDGKDESARNRPRSVTAYNPDDLCRSIQAFTAKKMQISSNTVEKLAKYNTFSI